MFTKDSIKKYNSELINLLNTLSDTLAKLSRSYIRISEIYGETGAPELFDVMNELGKTFQKSRSTCTNFIKVINEDFDDYFNFYVQELDELINVLNSYKNTEEQFKRASKNLLEKKEYLHAQRKIESWGLRIDCPYTIEALYKDKNIAFAEMLPEETKEVIRQQKIYGYLCNELPKEYKRISKRNAHDFSAHFMDVSKDSRSILLKVIS